MKWSVRVSSGKPWLPLFWYLPKEMQKLLMRRKSELEAQLVRARGTDFANVKSDAVGIGTRVQVTDLASANDETFTVLGAWDGNPEKGIISYLTPMGQALFGHKPGEEIEFEMDGARRRYRVEKIEAYQPPPPPPA